MVRAWGVGNLGVRARGDEPIFKMKTKPTALSRRVDTDISALKACIRGLDKSTSRRMLKANLEYLIDRYLRNPSQQLPEQLRTDPL